MLFKSVFSDVILTGDKDVSVDKKESQIVSEIIKWLYDEGIFYWRVPLGGVIHGNRKFVAKNPMAGHPDIAGIVPNSGGRYFAIEVKRQKGGRLSDGQKEWLSKLARHGALCFVARSLEDVQAHFTNFSEDQPA